MWVRFMWCPRAARLGPVLFLFDEFAALGHLEPVERSMGLMAVYAVHLRALCRQRVGTFPSNAGVLWELSYYDDREFALELDLA